MTGSMTGWIPGWTRGPRLQLARTGGPSSTIAATANALQALPSKLVATFAHGLDTFLGPRAKNDLSLGLEELGCRVLVLERAKLHKGLTTCVGSDRAGPIMTQAAVAGSNNVPDAPA